MAEAEPQEAVARSIEGLRLDDTTPSNPSNAAANLPHVETEDAPDPGLDTDHEWIPGIPSSSTDTQQDAQRDSSGARLCEDDDDETLIDSSINRSSSSQILDISQIEEWTLLTLPAELLLMIFDYLDARQVIREVGFVCKTLNGMISQNQEWKLRFRKRWRRKYPVVPVDDDEFNWKLACIEREETHSRWSKHETKMEHFSLTDAHIGAIDCVHLMNNAELCVTGSRDRTFHMWDLRKLDAKEPNKSVKAARTKDVKGHKGWVWDITSLDHRLCTASWDCWLKLWDVNADVRPIQEIKGKSAFLSVVFRPDVIVAGAYDKSVYVYDPRGDALSLVNQLVHHKRPVLKVQMDDNHIISGSEDKTIAIYDRRAAKVYKKLELKSFCMCMSYNHGQLWTGQKNGKINVIDPTHGKFDMVQTYDVGHKGKITDIINTLGALYTCSTDATIKISQPHHKPDTMCTLTPHNCDITALDLQNGVLASASSDLTAAIWRPTQGDGLDETES